MPTSMCVLAAVLRIAYTVYVYVNAPKDLAAVETLDLIFSQAVFSFSHRDDCPNILI